MVFICIEGLSEDESLMHAWKIREVSTIFLFGNQKESFGSASKALQRTGPVLWKK